MRINNLFVAYSIHAFLFCFGILVGVEYKNYIENNKKVKYQEHYCELFGFLNEE